MAKFQAIKMKQAPASIETKRARNRRNSQNFQNRRRREAAEIEARVSYLDDCHRSAENFTKFLERKFLRFFGPDALKELRHTVHPFEIDLKAFEELHKDIRTKEQKLAEIERQRRYQLGINLMTNASQKSRMSASLKLTQLKLRELVLEGQVKEYRAWQEALEAALGTDPPLAEFYDSSAAIDSNVADDRSSEDRGWQNPGQLEASQNTENVDFFDMPFLERQKDPSKAEESEDAVRNYISNKFHSTTSGGWQKKEMTLNDTDLQHTHDRFLLEWSHGTYTATGSHDFFGETRYEPSKIKIQSPPSPLNNPPQLPVSPTEHLFEDHSLDGKWNRAPEPSPSSSLDSGELAEGIWELEWPAPNPASTNDAGLPAEDSMEPDWLEPSSDRHHTTAAMDRWTANGQEF